MDPLLFMICIGAVMLVLGFAIRYYTPKEQTDLRAGAQFWIALGASIAVTSALCWVFLPSV